jgi:hypothetical protein
VWNLTLMQLTKVNWPGLPPVAVLPSGAQIMQIVAWIPGLNCWVRVGSQGASKDGGTVNLTFSEVEFLAQMVDRGSPLLPALSLIFPG